MNDPKLPRPSAEQPTYRHITNSETLRTELAKAESQWEADQAEPKRIADWSADLRAEREANAAAEHAEHEANRLPATQESRAAFEAILRPECLARVALPLAPDPNVKSLHSADDEAIAA